MSHRGNTTKLVIHQNQSSHRHHKSCYLAARHYIFPYQSASQPGLLMVSQSSSFWSSVNFFASCKHFHLIHQVTGRGECSNRPSPRFLKLTCWLLEKQIVFSQLSSGGKERNNLHKNIDKCTLLTFLLILWKKFSGEKLRHFKPGLFSTRDRGTNFRGGKKTHPV